MSIPCKFLQKLPFDCSELYLLVITGSCSAGDLKVVNSVVLGILSILKPNIFKKKTILKVLAETFSKKEILEANFKGFDRGQELASK